MVRDELIKLCGVTLMLLGITGLVIGFLIDYRFVMGTGFMMCAIAVVLLYYMRIVAGNKQKEEEPVDNAPVAMQNQPDSGK